MQRGRDPRTPTQRHETKKLALTARVHHLEGALQLHLPVASRGECGCVAAGHHHAKQAPWTHLRDLSVDRLGRMRTSLKPSFTSHSTRGMLRVGLELERLLCAHRQAWRGNWAGLELTQLQFSKTQGGLG